MTSAPSSFFNDLHVKLREVVLEKTQLLSSSISRDPLQEQASPGLSINKGSFSLQSKSVIKMRDLYIVIMAYLNENGCKILVSTVVESDCISIIIKSEKLVTIFVSYAGKDKKSVLCTVG